MKLAAFLLLTLAAGAPANVNFDELALPASGFNNNTGGFASNGVAFNNTFVDYGGGFSGWNGFSLSNVANTTNGDFSNQYAAYANVSGKGNYAVAYPEATITLPAGQRVESLQIANTTYAALSMRNGDGFAKKFGGPTGNDADFFSVTFTGRDAGGGVTGSATYFLADFRFADNARDYILGDWATLDLRPLGDATTIGIDFASSDVGRFGINTPTYVAVDNLTLVPEPATLAAAAGLLGLALRRSRRR